MAYPRPTLSALIATASADLLGRFPGADTALRRTVLGVLARVIAGAAHGLYGFLDWLSRQIHVDTSDQDVLVRQAAIWGIEPKGAEPAAGNVTITGVNGSTVPAGSILQRGDAVEYATQADATIAGGTAAVAIEAAEPGFTGNAAAGVALTFVSPVAGVAAGAVVATGGLAGGGDAEDVEALRLRLLGRIRAQPQGGALRDYERWALEVADVTRAWVRPGWAGPGSVGVTFVCDGRLNIIPLTADLNAVAAHIDPLRPVTAQVIVFACTPVARTFTIDLTPDTSAVRAAVTASLADLLQREASPGGTILLSHIRAAISGAAGEENYVMTAPTADVVHAPDEFAVMGAVTWV